MRTREIGDAITTVVGLGDVRLTLADARGLDARDVERAVNEALELGVTLVDASEEEAAERLCGDAVRALRLRDRVVVSTRVPVLAARPGAPNRDLLPERLPVGYLQERIEASLRSTRLDALPLALLPVHAAWLASAAWPELVGTCLRLVREGKVMRWGAMLDEPVELAEPFVAILTRFNGCERVSESLLGGKLAVLAREPLAGGALGGLLGPGVKLSPRDDRRTLDDAALERIAVAAARLAPLARHEPPAARSCDAARAALERTPRPPHVEATTVGELALRYVIDRGAFAMVRLHRREHIAEAIAAASAPPLSDEVRARIEQVFPLASEKRDT